MDAVQELQAQLTKVRQEMAKLVELLEALKVQAVPAPKKTTPK